MNNIKDITDFIFLQNEPEKADIIFIPGGSYPETMELAAKLWKEGYAPYLLPSGKYSVKLGYFPGPKLRGEIYNGAYSTEWEYMKDIAVKNGVYEGAVLREDESQTTIENVEFTRRVTDSLNMDIKKAIICCKSFHARRCFMLYSWMYPDTEFIVCPVDNRGINRDNWYMTEYGVNRVMGELGRCGNQLQEAVSVWKEHL